MFSENVTNILLKHKNVASSENIKIAKKFKTAVRSCKFLAREARRKFWNVNLHYSKKQIKNTGCVWGFKRSETLSITH